MKVFFHGSANVDAVGKKFISLVGEISSRVFS